MRKIGIVAIMGLFFIAGIAFVYSCGGGSTSSAATLSELENRVLALESKLTPAYDSGWLAISQNGELILNHNLDGNAEDLLVDVMQWSSIAGIPARITNRFNGLVYSAGIHGITWTLYADSNGALIDSNIRVYRGDSDGYAEKIRVRIWDLGI